MINRLKKLITLKKTNTAPKHLQEVAIAAAKVKRIRKAAQNLARLPHAK